MTAIEGKGRLLRAGGFAAIFVAMVVVAGGAAATGTETVLYNFQGGTTDGATPYAGLSSPDSSGNFYGATFSGGSSGQGIVFKVTPTGTETVLYNLPGGAGGINGAGPTGTPVFDGTNILGTAAYNSVSNGVGSGDGVVYELAPNVTGGYIYSVLHPFAGGSTDGANPFAGLSNPDSSGNYYGTTSAGGGSSDGIVFELTKSGTGTYTCCTNLHFFAGGSSDGANGYGGVLYYSNGSTSTLYGATVLGGSSDDGVVLKLSPSSWTPTILHGFTGSGTDGALPRSGLIMDSSGNLYGTASFNGSSGDGVVFEVTSTGTSTLHSFSGSGTDGAYPWSSLTPDSSGNLYGTTTSGGTYGYGVIFELTKTMSGYTYNTLYSFKGGSADGATPYAGLTMDSSGNFYGTTTSGGTYGYGVVFKYTP